MDWESGKQRLTCCITKYKYIIVALIAGIIILLIPQTAETPPPISDPEEKIQNLQVQLEGILGQISGVGKVKVLLTEASGCDTIYQVDENRNQSNLDTVIVTNGQREEVGLIKQIIPPEYRGAVVVCQGADRAAVRLMVVEAVRSVTGLSSDCITVLKMK